MSFLSISELKNVMSTLLFIIICLVSTLVIRYKNVTNISCEFSIYERMYVCICTICKQRIVILTLIVCSLAGYV